MALPMRRLVLVGCFLGWLWWRAMRCNTSHGVVGALRSQAEHVRGTVWESWGTFGRSHMVMWCFRTRHSAPWWMTVICVGSASLRASSRVSGGTGPATEGTGLCFEPVGA